MRVRRHAGAAWPSVVPRRQLRGVSLFVVLTALASAGARAADSCSQTGWGGALLLGVTVVQERVVAVGERGVIVTSNDGGGSWTRRASPTHMTLNKVRFRDATHGWAVGAQGTILATADGGDTWQLQRENSAQLDDPWLDVVFTDVVVAAEDILVTGSQGALARSGDAGRTWTLEKLTTPAGLDANLLAGAADAAGRVYISTEKSALIEGGGLYIGDGVSSGWTSVSVPSRGTVAGVVPDGAGRGIMFGLLGEVLSFDRAGEQFVPLSSPATDTLLSGVRRQDGTVVLVGLVGNVLVYRGFGQGLEKVDVASRQGFSDVAEDSFGHLWVAGEGGVKQLCRATGTPL